jgi:hypothetical protein
VPEKSVGVEFLTDLVYDLTVGRGSPSVATGGSMNPRFSDVWAPIKGGVVKQHFIFNFVGIFFFIAFVEDNAIFTMHAAVFGLLPLAPGIGAGSQMQQPLAIALIGGFSVSSLLLFFVLPVFYRLFTLRKKSGEP